MCLWKVWCHIKKKISKVKYQCQQCRESTLKSWKLKQKGQSQEFFISRNDFKVELKMKSVLKLSGPPSQSSSLFPKHEETRSITTPPWMRHNPIARLPPLPSSIWPGFTDTHLYSWLKRGTVNKPFNSQEWPKENFSLHYQYNINHISDENKEKYQFGDNKLIQ